VGLLNKRYRFGVWMFLATVGAYIAGETIKVSLWQVGLVLAFYSVPMIATVSYFRKRWQYLA